MANTNGQQRPKLELKLNQPVRLRLLRDEPHVGQSSRGPYYLYSVQDEQKQEYAWFAPVDIHEAMQNSELKSGSAVSVKRVKGGRVELSILAKNGEGQGTGRTTEDRYREMMERSLEDAIAATRAVNSVQWDVDSIRSIALSLFIQRAKAS